MILMKGWKYLSLFVLLAAVVRSRYAWRRPNNGFVGHYIKLKLCAFLKIIIPMIDVVTTQERDSFGGQF